MQANKVSVVRGGKILIIEAIHIVPGDIIKITGGEKVPADIR